MKRTRLFGQLAGVAGVAGLLLLVVAALLVAGCAGGGAGASDAVGTEVREGPWNRPVPAEAVVGGVEEARSAESRPGLATGWGERVESRVSYRSFERGSSKPAGTDAIWYNDREGLEAMGGRRWKVEAMQAAAGGLVEWGVKGRVGWLPAYKSGYWGGRRFVEGGRGGRYRLVVKNRCRSRLEVVLSVDGLDVMDGKPAAYRKRGYLVGPGETLEVGGFRTSEDAVAAFEFSGVGDSYANLRHGDTRNVGVLGLAVFTEKGCDPWTWMPQEVGRRDSARAFAEAP